MSNPGIVMLHTSHPGNIGAVARAMKNMGLDRLCLVRPAQFPSAEATARASGADGLLENAGVFDSLEEAVADVTLVLGASARNRTLPLPVIDPRQCATLVAQHTGPSAILFGRERTGLTNEELDRCHYLVQIPTNPAYPSLNIAMAVQVIAYELRMQAGTDEPREDSRDYATDRQMEQFYEHLERTLLELGFLDPGNPKQLMRRLRRLYGRVHPDQNEINILRGILTATNKKTV